MSNYNDPVNQAPTQPPKGYTWNPQIGQWVPKKKHTGLKVFAVLTILFFFGLVTCTALVTSGGDNNPSTGVTEGKPVATQAPKATTTAPPKETTQKLVKGTQVGPFTLQASVQIKEDGIGSFTSDVSVKNHTDEAQMAMFKITMLKGDDILGTLTCIGGGGNQIGPGATTTAHCISSEDYVKGWTKVQMEHTGF